MYRQNVPVFGMESRLHEQIIKRDGEQEHERPSSSRQAHQYDTGQYERDNIPGDVKVLLYRPDEGARAAGPGIRGRSELDQPCPAKLYNRGPVGRAVVAYCNKDLASVAA